MKALVGTFNHEKALVGAFSMIVKNDVSFAALVVLWRNIFWHICPPVSCSERLFVKKRKECVWINISVTSVGKMVFYQPVSLSPDLVFRGGTSFLSLGSLEKVEMQTNGWYKCHQVWHSAKLRDSHLRVSVRIMSRSFNCVHHLGQQWFDHSLTEELKCLLNICILHERGARSKAGG